MGNWNDDLLMFTRKNPFPYLLRARFEQNSTMILIKVEDEVKFPEYIDVTEQAKSFILGIMQKNPDDRFTMKDIFKHVFIRKYLGDKRLAPEIIQEFQKVLS